MSAAATPAAPAIPVRHVDFGFGSHELPRYFYDNDPFATTFFMAFSLVIPQGERFFIQSVRHYLQDIDDLSLRARVAGFIGQEGMHGREHDAANAAYDAMGFPSAPVERGIRRLLRTVGRLPKPVQLAFTTALEHFTAIISYDVVGTREVNRKFAPEVRDFILWHMMEELEHKAVAYDVYRTRVGSYLIRSGTMIPIALGLFPVLTRIQLFLLRADGQPFSWRRHRRGVAAIYGRDGLFWRIFPNLLDYFRPGFHPDDHDSTQMLARMKTELLGERGRLGARLGKTTIPRPAAAPALA